MISGLPILMGGRKEYEYEIKRLEGWKILALRF
jgi:hypothetical protein